MPSTSEKQARFWVFKKHDPNSTDEERKVAEEFIEADKKEGKWSMYKKDKNKNDIEDSKEELLWELESITLEDYVDFTNYVANNIEFIKDNVNISEFVLEHKASEDKAYLARRASEDFVEKIMSMTPSISLSEIKKHIGNVRKYSKYALGTAATLAAITAAYKAYKKHKLKNDISKEELSEIEIFNCILESIDYDFSLESEKEIVETLKGFKTRLGDHKLALENCNKKLQSIMNDYPVNPEGSSKIKSILTQLATSAGGLIAVAAAAKLIKNIVKKYKAKKADKEDKEEISKEELDIVLESLNNGKELIEIFSNEELIKSFSLEDLDNETMSSLLFDAGKKLGTSVFKISRKILSNIFKELFNSNKDISLDISRKYNIDPDLAEKLYTDVFNNNIKIRALRRLGYLLGGTTLLTGGILLHNKLKEDDKHNY